MIKDGRAYFPEGCAARGGITEPFEEDQVHFRVEHYTDADGMSRNTELILSVGQEKPHGDSNGFSAVYEADTPEAFFASYAEENKERLKSFVCRVTKACPGTLLHNGVEQCGALNEQNILNELESYAKEGLL